jgi:hypothetical protein
MLQGRPKTRLQRDVYSPMSRNSAATQREAACGCHKLPTDLRGCKVRHGTLGRGTGKLCDQDKEQRRNIRGRTHGGREGKAQGGREDKDPRRRSMLLTALIYASDIEECNIAHTAYDSDEECNMHDSSRLASIAMASVDVGGVWRTGLDRLSARGGRVRVRVLLFR